MNASSSILLLSLLAMASLLVSAYDPSPLQDYCVAVEDPKDSLFVNGKFCKDPKHVKPEDFFFTGLNIPGNTSNPVGSKVTLAHVGVFPGLNTLGISMGRVDYAPNGGVNPPHFHPRATEILTVLEGTLYVGFVESNPNNRLFSKVLKKGDVFVFPFGMIHFQLNVGKKPASAIVALTSQNPSVTTIATTVFGSNPPIDTKALTRGFQLDKKIVDQLQTEFRKSIFH